MKPILYEANTVDFNSNGLGALTEAMFSQVTEERNGILELSVVYPMSGKLYDRISEHMLLKVKPNKVDDPHVFRIYSLQIDSIAQTVSIDASTKSNELVNNLVKDLAIENTTPQVALDLMKQFLVLPTDYDFISDITSSNSTHWTNRNPLNCIAGEEGSLVDVFGGEIKRGNRTIWLYANRGIDNPNIIRHGKNLQGFTVEYSTKGMTTAILPYFNEKIEESSETRMVYGDIVYSQYANNYPFLYLVAMDYSSEEEVTNLATLNTKASQYFTEHNGIDKPSMSATVDMQDLSDSSEYKRFKSLEHIQLCDTVTVYSKKHKVNLNAKVTKIIFDTLLEKNVSLELGSIRTSLTDSIKQGYTETIQDLQQNIYQTIETAANGKNRVFRGVEEPITGMIKNDVWYKPVNDGEIEMYVFDGATWNKEAYSADSLGGTVNFANVRAINIDASSITTGALRADLVQAGFNGIAQGVSMTADGLKAVAASGEYSIVENGGVSFFTKNDVKTGSIESGYLVSDGTNGVSVFVEPGRFFSVNKKNELGVNERFIHIPHDKNEIRLQKPVSVTRLNIAGTNQYITNMSNQGGVFFDTVRVSLGTGTLDAVSKVISAEPGKAIIHTPSFFNRPLTIKDVSSVLGGKIFDYADTLLLGGAQGTNVGYATAEGGVMTVMRFQNGEIRAHAKLNMNGNAITNQSDIRLKDKVVDAVVDPFSVIEKMRFINFEWDATNPYNEKKPTGEQFGIEAQYSPFLTVKDQGSNYLSIDMGKQVNINSMALQRMISEIKTLKEENAETKKELAELKRMRLWR